MPYQIPIEVREKAESLYVTEGYSYREISESLGVSISKLHNWGKNGKWKQRKAEYRNAFIDFKRDIVLLRRDLLKKALETKDPQDVYALSNLERAFQSRKDSDDPPITSDTPIKTPINSTADAVAALQKGLERRINALLAQPGSINLESIKSVKQAMDLLEKMTTLYNKDADTDSESSEESRKKLEDEVNRILGIGK